MEALEGEGRGQPGLGGVAPRTTDKTRTCDGGSDRPWPPPHVRDVTLVATSTTSFDGSRGGRKF